MAIFNFTPTLLAHQALTTPLTGLVFLVGLTQVV
jgi:hypothetical protein